MFKPQALILATVLAFAAEPASALYKCKDAKGNTYYTDRPPAACLGKEMDVLDKQGNVVKRREAMLTPEQQAAREAEEKRKSEQEIQEREEKRKNQALLNTYSSEKDIEDGRGRALAQSEQAAKEIQKRIAEAQDRAKKLAGDKEFYAKKPMPKKLQDDIKNNDMDLKMQQEALAGRQKELSEINAKYDEDKRRYIELTGAKPRSAPSSKK